MSKRMTSCLTVMAGLIMLLSGCATTKIKSNNNWVSSVNQEHAMVYFMRPLQQRTRGMADGDLEVELDKEPLATLSHGEYIALPIKPGAVDVIMRNWSYLTTQPMPVKVWRVRRFEFEAGKTYYLSARFTQEEFRGIYYVPELLSEAQAKEQAQDMVAANDAARRMPLYIPPAVPLTGDAVSDALN